MAFNPFHSFRKYQRPLIAALAIFCMLMFVVSSGLGRGDAVYQLLGVIGINRSRGAVVATLHGKKVTEGDLALLRRDRELATNFLFVIARNGTQNRIIKMAREQQQNQAAPEAAPRNQEINQILLLWSTIYSDRDGRFAISRKQRYDFAKQSLQTVRRESMLSRFTAGQGPRPDSAVQLDQLARALAFEVWVNDPQRNPREYYFGGTPDTADLLDFLLWEQQADRLGVVLTEADVIQAVNREGADQGLLSGPTLNVEPLVGQFLEQSNTARGATPAQLAKALNREYRYLLAQESVLGMEGGVRAGRQPADEAPVEASQRVPQPPAAGTPREFLDWFREQRTTLKVAILPVPVQKYVDQVKEVPSEATLKDLYNEFKGDEPAPDRQLPAFKEPRRVRVEAVSARPDSEFYRDAARARALAPVAGAVVGGPFGGPVAAAWPIAYDPLWRAYSIYADDTRSWVQKGFGTGVDLTDRRAEYAAVAAAALGGTPTAPLAAATTALAEEAAYRGGIAKVAAALWAADAGGQPLAGIALPMPFDLAVLPAEQMTATLFAKVVDGLAPDLVTKNLSDMAAELFKLKSRPSEAQAYVAKVVKDFHLTDYQMTKPKTGYELEDDPALQALKAAVDAEAFTGNLDAPAPTLARVLLNGVGVYDPQRFPPGQRWVMTKEPFVWWRTEDLPARERPFDVVRARVVEAWRFDQARRLARAEADRIEADVKKNVGANKSAAEAVKVLAGFGSPFVLDDVARLLPVSTPLAEAGQPYRPYAVPHDRVPYPRPDFVDRLLALKAPGDVTVLRDRPAATLYVAVLENRDDPTRSGSAPSLAAFRSEFSNAAKSGSLWQQHFLPDRRRAYVTEVLKQMRIDAVGAKDVDEQGNIRLPEGISPGTETETGGGGE